MTELEPRLYMRAEQREMTAKGGGGGARPPWVDIDETGLRSQLAASVQTGLTVLQTMPTEVRSQVGIPIRIELRDQALAKSNRPTAFLTSAGVPPVAVRHAGELISRVRELEGASFERAISTGSTKSDVYAISTIQEISVFEPLKDAFGFDDEAAVDELLAEARAEDKLLRIDLFPWLHSDTRWQHGTTFAEHLQEIGFSIRGIRGNQQRESIYLAPAKATDVAELTNLYGIRHASLEPTYGHWGGVGPQSMAIVGGVDDALRTLLAEDPGPAVVGVLDSGIEAAALEPWVIARERYDLGSEVNPEHGTFVGGLILAGRALNPDEACFDHDSARLIDGQVLPAGPSGIGELELLERMTEVVRKYPQTKVWNCSFARQDELRPIEYSVFASEMDALAAELGILFVQAAGNFNDPGGRPWPPSTPLGDGIASPADAVNSLAVGSLSHRGGRTPVGAPASYSRRGPSFGGQTKPDVSFWSGDFGPSGEVPFAGIRSTVPTDAIAEGVGTSFATPLVSSIAANIWSELDGVNSVEVTPALVKGLVVHGAAINSRNLVNNYRNYYGAGVPLSGIQSLFEDNNSFTTVHDVTLSSKVSWLRAPFPIPACLMTGDGKLRAEVFMTVSYSPILDRACGQEAVRTCVDASFGVIDRSEGDPKITGKVPEVKTTGPHPWESDLVAAGKWSPVRTHHTRFPLGCTGQEWGLKLTLTERHDYEDGIEQRAYVIVTLRGLDDDLQVHADGVRAIQQLALWNTPLSVRTSVTVET